MIRRYCTFFILFFLFTSFLAVAQPTLPDIAGSVEKGVVVLSWNCQYDGIKAITVMRSDDSTGNFEIIGYVKTLNKGVQAFVDGHPLAGKNYYKLSLVFKSGLTWRSNHIGVHVAKAELESSKRLLPSNDSLQELLVTKEEIKKKGPRGNKVIKESDLKFSENSGQSSKPATGKGSGNVMKSTQPDTCKKTTVPKVSVSFGTDNTEKNAPAAENERPRPKIKIVVTFEEPADNAPVFMKSKFIEIDTATGHIKMYLPDDVSTHHYSVKFYDKDKHVVLEVPKIMSSKIIIDKRNFQRNGVYKFTLRKDYTELESGFLIIDPRSQDE